MADGAVASRRPPTRPGALGDPALPPLLQGKSFSGRKTTLDTIEDALRLLVPQKDQVKISSLRGKLSCEGDLERMRTDS